MSRLLFLLCLAGCLLTASNMYGQILDPVKWTQRYVHIEGQTYDLEFKAVMEKDWSVYSQDIGADGPIPTTFTFEKGDHFSLVGKVKESGNKKEGYDPIFDMHVIKYEGQAVFTQRIRLLKPGVPIKGYFEFMTCDKERCLPPKEVDFQFVLSSDPKAATSEPTDASSSGDNIAISMNQTAGAAQGEGMFDPVEWSARLEQTGANRYRAIFEAKVQEGWYIYSQENAKDDGPIPTTFTYKDASGVKAIGSPAEEGDGRIKAFDPMFDMEVIKYKDAVRFWQDFEVANPSVTVDGFLEYMTCDDQRCLFPPGLDYRIDFQNSLITFLANQGNIDSDGAAIYPFQPEALGEPLSDCAFSTSVDTSRKGLWTIFLLGFIGGLLALLTPCVFPMIPLTVSFFTKGSKDRRKGLINASLYGFFIFLVYLLLSIPFHVMDSINPDILNDISTNVWLNIAFFVIFLFFAFSFFGYYELTLPESLTNRVSAAEGVGGLLGIFFMALTLALVSFSCTGPILGSLLAGALTGDGGAIQLTSGMAGFGLALALPFALFAAFPGWMSSLPRSGGWLNTVKVVLGFLELALAFKFLSNADLVKHWGLLKIEPFLIIWIFIALAMAMYLFGLIRFPHDSPGQKLSKTRIGLGVLSFAAALYMATGFRYDEAKSSFTPLTLLSGLAPPVGYSWIYPKHCPNNLDCFKDLDDGMAYAREKNKPVMIDFTGHACVNCRKMEEHVWPLPEVDKYIRNEYVLISLYVDEKLELPEEERITIPSKVTGTRTLKRTGDKWQHLQTEYFNNNSQPFYVLLSPDGRLLTNPVGYTPDAKEYAAFLECGLKAWQDLK